MGAPETIRGGLGELARRLDELGTRRVLILCSPSRRYVDQVSAALQHFQPQVFDGARVHVPREVLEAAERALGEADTLVAVGGGSAIGLGKALRLQHALRFAVVPTTYSGSEMTTIWGITTGGEKST